MKMTVTPLELCVALGLLNPHTLEEESEQDDDDSVGDSTSSNDRGRVTEEEFDA